MRWKRSLDGLHGRYPATEIVRPSATANYALLCRHGIVMMFSSPKPSRATGYLVERVACHYWARIIAFEVLAVLGR